MADTKAKTPRKRKCEYVDEIVALTEKRGLEWNVKNLEEKTTIPNLKNIITVLMEGCCHAVRWLPLLSHHFLYGNL